MQMPYVVVTRHLGAGSLSPFLQLCHETENPLHAMNEAPAKDGADDKIPPSFRL